MGDWIGRVVSNEAIAARLREMDEEAEEYVKALCYGGQKTSRSGVDPAPEVSRRRDPVSRSPLYPVENDE